MNTSLQPPRTPEPASTGPFRPLAARDYFGGSPPPRVASPRFQPLSTPDVFTGGRFRQLLSDRASLKSLDSSAFNLKPLDSPGDLPSTKLSRKLPQDQHEALTQQAQKWVAQTFFGTLLKQMHESPFKSHLLDGGRGGEAFQPLMDQQLIERMSHASGKKLVRGIVRQIEGRAAYQNQRTEDGGLKTETKMPIPNARIHVAPGLRA